MSNEIKSNDGMSVVVQREGDPGRTLFSDQAMPSGSFVPAPEESPIEIAQRNYRAAVKLRDEQSHG